MKHLHRALVVALASAISVSVVAIAPSGASAPTQAPSGTVRLAAEGEPSCADWVASCAGSVWG